MKTLSLETNLRTVKLLTPISTITGLVALVAIPFALQQYTLVVVLIAFVAYAALSIAEFQLTKHHDFRSSHPKRVWRLGSLVCWGVVVLIYMYKVWLL